MDQQQKEPKVKWKKLRGILLRDICLVAVIAAGWTILNLVTGKGCILNILFDINCPFCGMTRAHLAALRLDFAAAFQFHPLFFLGVPYLFLITHDELFTGKWEKFQQISVIVLTIIFIVRYIVSLLL